MQRAIRRTLKFLGMALASFAVVAMAQAQTGPRDWIYVYRGPPNPKFFVHAYRDGNMQQPHPRNPFNPAPGDFFFIRGYADQSQTSIFLETSDGWYTSPTGHDRAKWQAMGFVMMPSSDYPPARAAKTQLDDRDRQALLAQNAAKQQKEQQENEKRAQVERAKAAELEARQARTRAFASANGVSAFVGIEPLNVNPFPYEGKVVGVLVDFDTMTARETGLFVNRGQFLIASKLPSAKFTKRVQVMLAGKVIGKTETKLPLAGTIQVPHLEYVGAHLCEKRDCAEFYQN